MSELEARYQAAHTALDDLRDEARRLVRERMSRGDAAYEEAGYLAAANSALRELGLARTVVRVG